MRQIFLRSFGGLRAVSDVSFSIAQGEIPGIIGPTDGAGKTTLFNLLNEVLPPALDDGSAMLAGESMLGRKVYQVVRRMGVGRTFPRSVCASFARLPLLDNVVVGAYGAGLPDRDAVAAAETRRCGALVCCSSRHAWPDNLPTSSCG